ncbi:MAG: CPXCG motif-containing cysteine-rich protein [Flavobacteriia bacterium]|nr:CPXCG motif-containing cysteine-rich protein [Flavobacteriia bacterium]
MLEHFTNCPFCNADISVLIDPSIPHQNYIEDCEVCCRPLEISLTVENGELMSFDIQALEQ